MTRDEMIKKLVGHGYTLEGIQAASDAQLREMLRVCEAKDAKAAETGKPKTPKPLDSDPQKMQQLAEKRQRIKSFREQADKLEEECKGMEPDEEKKVEQYVEKFSEQFRGMKTSKEEVLTAFKARRKNNPSLTAAEFLNTSA